MTYRQLVEIAKRRGKVRWWRSDITEDVYLIGRMVWARKGMFGKPRYINAYPEIFAYEVTSYSPLRNEELKSALRRLIEIQPRDVQARMMIPADIALLLLRGG